jgi:hypothetical protein
VVPGHAVDVAQAADEVIVRRVGALPEGEDRRRAPRRWVSRHDDVYCSLVDEPLHVSLTDKSLRARNEGNMELHGQGTVMWWVYL